MAVAADESLCLVEHGLNRNKRTLDKYYRSFGKVTGRDNYATTLVTRLDDLHVVGSNQIHFIFF
jgi:hypothetical protein